MNFKISSILGILVLSLKNGAFGIRDTLRDTGLPEFSLDHIQKVERHVWIEVFEGLLHL